MECEVLVDKSSNPLLVSLQKVLNDYLSEKSSRNLSVLAKKCKVSEPTLRRIIKGQIKTLPTTTTILDILITISGEKNTSLIAKLYPGPIADYLENCLPQLQEIGVQYDPALNEELENSVKYIIYKLASNSSGVEKNKIEILFGGHGLLHAEDLLQKNYLAKKNNIYFTQSKDFTINQDRFIFNFKTIADYIKTENLLSNSGLQSLLANYSESISPEAYKEIIQVQKKALKKIREIMSHENSKGKIPMFLLTAIDTLDLESAFELEKKHKSN
jgi:hypothetical protein